jgi:NAD(P)-dependent dehydrogenase (short-subunit alcohol dehydrogenase family)
LDVLVNNVGAAFWRRRLSVDGIEMNFALNHLSHFLVTNLLIQELQDRPGARIVNISSGNHYHNQLDFDDLQLEHGYNPIKAYGKAKLANILFTYELDRRLNGTAVTSNAINPGRVSTNIWKNSGAAIGPLVGWVMIQGAQSPEEGAEAIIYLASAREVVGVSGKYFRKKNLMASDPETYDIESAKRLWEISAEMTGMTY